jgi:hypothetical protein
VSVERQPEFVYVIIVVPIGPAVAAPVTGLIVMIPAGNADQNPGAGALVYVALAPEHKLGGPVIGDGLGLTVTTVELTQLVPIVYLIVAVPKAAPLTSAYTELPDTPLDKIGASPGAVELHVPPMGVEFNVVVVPRQILVMPVMAVGIAKTVTVTDAIQPDT